MQFNLSNAKRRAVAVAAGVSTVLVSGLATAQAAPSDPGLAAIQSLTPTATSYIAAGFALLVVVVGGFWGMGMFKKVAGKAK